jgi:hypothetical protein
MAVRPYATRPPRCALQLVGDLVMVAWTLTWIWVAARVHALIVALGSAGFRLRDGAGGIAGSLGDAGRDAARVPIAGEELAVPLRSAGGAARHVAEVGQSFGDGITAVATPVAIAVAGSMILPLAVPWLLSRWRYARRAGAAAVLARTPAGKRLLALRALATAPCHRVLALSDDPVAAWAEGDGDVVDALARVELRGNGLRDRPRSTARR